MQLRQLIKSAFNRICWSSSSTSVNAGGLTVSVLFSLTVVSAAAFTDIDSNSVASERVKSTRRESYEKILDERYTCGRNALYALCSIMELPVQPRAFLPYSGDRPGPMGVSILQLERAAAAVGLPCVARKMEFEDVLRTPVPFIAHFTTSHASGSQSGHFVVVVKVEQDQVYYLDSTTAVFAPWSADTFKSFWSGYILQPACIIFSPSDNILDALLIPIPAATVIVMVLMAFGSSEGICHKRLKSMPIPHLAAPIVYLMLSSSAYAEVQRGQENVNSQNIVWRTPAHEAVNCAYLFLRLHGISVDYLDLMTQLPPRLSGTSILDVRDVCRQHDLPAVVARWTPDELQTNVLPVILQLSDRLDNGGAYAVLASKGAKHCYLITGDTATIRPVPIDTLRRHWSGYVVALETPWIQQLNQAPILCVLTFSAFYLLSRAIRAATNSRS